MPKRGAAFFGIFLFWWILTALVYRKTPSTFLRAESGWYLFLSHSDPVVQHGFERALLTKSFNGHYTPLAFLGEFVTAQLVGTHGGFWKWRQITVLALLATALFLFARHSGCTLQLSRFKASLSATALTAILIFQAQMREFVAWPFLIMQLFWLLFSVLALMSLVQMAHRPAEAIWSWLAAGAAYASLNFFGLGMATVAATAAGMSGVWWAIRRGTLPKPSKILVPLLSMIAIATLHAAVALTFARANGIPSLLGWQPVSFLTASLDFIPHFLVATLRSLFSTGRPTIEGWETGQDWPYGLAILLSVGVLISSAFLRCHREPGVRNRVRLVLQTFASVSFLMMIVLTAIREWHEPSPHGFADYLAAPRHLIPGTFALLGAVAEVLFVAASAPAFLYACLNVGVAACAIAGNLQYAAHVYPELAPQSMISHDRAWQAVVAMAGECRRASLAIPNVPLGALTQEFYDWDLKLFEPLLRADLQAPLGTRLQFAPWNGVANGMPNEYDRDVPSLAEVRKQLQLETGK